jgi:ribosomal protein S20
LKTAIPTLLNWCANAERVLARAASKGAIHANNASRRTGRLALLLNKGATA